MPVRRSWAAGLLVSGVPTILEENDKHAGRARRRDGAANILDRRRRAGNVKPGKIEIPARRSIGVLHIDNDQRGTRGIHVQWFGPGGQHRGHHAASDLTCRRQRISGWMRVPNASTPSTKESNVSRTPPRPEISDISSNIVAIRSYEPTSVPMFKFT